MRSSEGSPFSGILDSALSIEFLLNNSPRLVLDTAYTLTIPLRTKVARRTKSPIYGMKLR